MLEEYARAYCAKDIERLMALFDEGDNISFIGTRGEVLCAGCSAIQAAIQRNFSDATATQFSGDWMDVTVANGCAFVAITLINRP